MAFQFTQTGQEIQDILNQVGDNTSDISALDTRLTTAEGEIDTAQNDITALNQSLAQGVTRVDVSGTYGAVINWYTVIGKFVIGILRVTPNTTINNSIGEFNNALPYPPFVDTAVALHSVNTTEQKVQYAILKNNGQVGAYGAYTANVPTSGMYIYRMKD